jgi:hypothetical protein
MSDDEDEYQYSDYNYSEGEEEDNVSSTPAPKPKSSVGYSPQVANASYLVLRREDFLKTQSEMIKKFEDLVGFFNIVSCCFPWLVLT